MTRTVNILCPNAHEMPPLKLDFDGTARNVTCLECWAQVRSHLFVRDGEWVPSWEVVRFTNGE